MTNISSILSYGYEKALLLLPLPKISPQLPEPILSYQFTYKTRPENAIAIKKIRNENRKKNNVILEWEKKNEYINI